MEPPELTNFGSLIRFAVELEAATAGFYTAAGRLLGPGGPGDLARELAAQHENRRALLVRTPHGLERIHSGDVALLRPARSS